MKKEKGLLASGAKAAAGKGGDGRRNGGKKRKKKGKQAGGGEGGEDGTTDVFAELDGQWERPHFLDGSPRARDWWLKQSGVVSGGGNELEYLLQHATFQHYPVYRGQRRGRFGRISVLGRAMYVHTFLLVVRNRIHGWAILAFKVSHTV